MPASKREETTPFGDALCAAAREGDVRSLRQLLSDSSRGSVNDRESHFGSSALHWAGQFGNVEAAKFLLVRRLKCLVTQPAPDGLIQGDFSVQTPDLIGHLACRSQERGASVEAKDLKYGSTPLHTASFNGVLFRAHFLRRRSKCQLALRCWSRSLWPAGAMNHSGPYVVFFRRAPGCCEAPH